MPDFNADIIDVVTKNTFWQKEVYRDKQIQIVMMHIPPGEDIGEEVHPADQSTFIVSGEGEVMVSGRTSKIAQSHLVVVPKGRNHNFTNTGSEPLKLYSVYSPPAEPEGVAFKTKAEAEEAEED
ncbi:hypothetical protein BH09PSE2_BH09PSE2_12150 [soil metagenome]